MELFTKLFGNLLIFVYHCFDQTRNRHGWRCLAERKLRLRVRQYGERYLWFESISLHHPVPANRRGFRVRNNTRNSRRLARWVAVCGGASQAGAAPPCGAALSSPSREADIADRANLASDAEIVGAT